MRVAQGISVLGISRSHLEKLNIFLPDPDEQQRIADLLGALDDKIAALADRKARMHAFKKTMLQQMFVCSVPPTNLRPSYRGRGKDASVMLLAEQSAPNVTQAHDPGLCASRSTGRICLVKGVVPLA